MRKKRKVASDNGVTIETHVVADFNVAETPVGRVLGRTFPSSGRLALMSLQSGEADEIVYHPGQNGSAIVIDGGQTLVETLKRDPELTQRFGTLRGQAGLSVVLDGSSRFLAFVPGNPGAITKAKSSLFPRSTFKYTLKTTLHCDDACRRLLGSDQDLVDCANLCLVDHQLGRKYRCSRNGRLELLHGTKSPSRRQRLGRALSNALDPAKTILGVAGEATAFFPPASGAVKGVLAAYAVATTSQEHKKQAKAMLHRSEKLSCEIARFTQGVYGQSQEDTMREVYDVASKQQFTRPRLQTILDSSRISRVTRLNRNKDLLQETQQDLVVAERNFSALKNAHLIRLGLESSAKVEHDIAEFKHEVSRKLTILSFACFRSPARFPAALMSEDHSLVLHPSLIGEDGVCYFRHESSRMLVPPKG